MSLSKAAVVLAILVLMAGMIVLGSVSSTNTVVKDDAARHYWVEKIEGCEYIHRGQWFAHKGNCSNPIHIYNKEATNGSN